MNLLHINDRCVVAAVIKKDNKYLIAQRNRNKHFAFYWEFPGGKVDKGETFEIALLREINEELSIGIKILKKYHLRYTKMIK